MFEKLKRWREERGLENKVGNIELNIYEELLELIGFEDENEIEFFKYKFENEFENLFGKAPINKSIDALCDIIVFAINAIEAKGYDAEACINETIKEISSRTGAYNSDTKKWEKFKTDKAISIWYEADYPSCKKGVSDDK